MRAQRHKLAVRLPYFTLRLSADMPAGAHVARNGSELRAPSFGVPLPVDPGNVELLVTERRRPFQRRAHRSWRRRS